jgi:hypothetical protein
MSPAPRAAPKKGDIRKGSSDHEIVISQHFRNIAATIAASSRFNAVGAWVRAHCRWAVERFDRQGRLGVRHVRL